MIEFKYTRTEPYSDIVFRMSEYSHIGEVIEEFNRFLIGIGYVLPHNASVDIVHTDVVYE